jgi:hypothetical protein
MKNLSDVTKEDAIKILSVEYSLFFKTGRWQFTDESEGVGEPCKKLYCKLKSYMFWFFDDCIDIELIDAQINFDNTNFDVKVRCYVEAYNLGYKVYQFDQLKVK